MATTEEKFTTEELTRINDADDLKISPFRPDGITYGTPTWIWEVVVNGDLYVRAYHGTSSSWFQAALQLRAGRIQAAGTVRDVYFVPVLDNNTILRIDAAYQAKYSGSPYLAQMTGSRAKSATIKIIPQQA